MSAPSSLRARLTALQKQSGQSRNIQTLDAESISRGLSRLSVTRRKRSQVLEQRLQDHLDVPRDDSGIIQLQFAVPLHCAGLSGSVPGSLSGQPWPDCCETGRMIFIDTETTGLSGGTGTLVFQVGLCWFENNELQVYQALLTRPGAERDFLEAVVSKVDRNALLVSYNGKAFDLPLLATRQKMNRLDDRLSGLPHVDLLYAVRRAFRRVWPDCTLKSAEQRLLGVRRKGDLPGAMAPEAWKGFVLGKHYQPVAEVLRHNQQDIVSLAGLAVVLTEVYEDPEAHRADFCGVAQSWVNDSHQRAEAILERSLPSDHRAKLMLADLRRRREGYDAAVQLWHQLAESFLCTESLRRLAIYYEHHKKDPKTAHEYATQLVKLDKKDEHEHRLRRLSASLL